MVDWMRVTLSHPLFALILPRDEFLKIHGAEIPVHAVAG